MARKHHVRIDDELWLRYKKASSSYFFGTGDLIDWILRCLEDDDVECYAKDFETSLKEIGREAGASYEKIELDLKHMRDKKLEQESKEVI